MGDLFTVYDGRVPREADLVTYWHEKARAQISEGRTRRAGLLATQGIRGGANRKVLERIAETGGIFFARSDDAWVLAGANVHISFVGQDDGRETERELDGQPMATINADLSAGLDLTTARRLCENLGIAFIGDSKGGPFEIDADTAQAMLASPNPDARSNAAVVRRWANGLDVGGRPRSMWIVDFGGERDQQAAALFEAPFEYVRARVRPRRVADDSRTTRSEWWLHERPRPELRAATRGLARIAVTIRHSKHRLWAWVPAATLPDSALVAIAREDDYTFGVLHSRAHELWARGTGTQLREVESGFRYTPTTCFETFPFPRPTAEQREAIAAAAQRLVELRDGWLNPPGPDPAALAVRTLTNLYNQRPTWLANAHDALDVAVLAAYGWRFDLANPDILERLLDLNLEREPA